ncbi:MAG: hypothetical protein ACLPN5_10375 [Roseiarcus sp.]
MTALLQRAFEAVASLPEGEQDDYARLLLRLLGREASVVELSEEEQADLEEAEREAARGEFATDDEMAELWAKYRG